MAFSSLLEKFVLNLPTTTLLDYTLFVTIYDFVKFDIEKCMKIGEKLYRHIEDDPEDKNLILRKCSFISQKVGKLKDLNFWHILSNLNLYLMDKEEMSLIQFEGFFFTKDNDTPILYGDCIGNFYDFENIMEDCDCGHFPTFSQEKNQYPAKYGFGIETEICGFIKNTWDLTDTERANSFKGKDSFLEEDTKYEDVLKWNFEIICNLSLQDMKFLVELKTKILQEHLLMNNQNYTYAPWNASGFIFTKKGKLVIFHER